MIPAPQSPAPRRHVWRWVLLGAGLCLTPFLLLGIAAVSYLTLDRDARVLRHQLMAATDANWNTKAQVSVGRLTLATIGQGLRFVPHKDIADARLALRAVKHASIGVMIDATNNVIHADNKKLILLQGLDDFVVVDTKDVLLICKKDKEQDIKEYVAEIKRNKGEKYL